MLKKEFKACSNYLYNSNYNLFIISRSAVSHVEAGIASKEITSEMTCIWVNGIVDLVTNEYLKSHFSQFGPIHKCLID